MFAAVLLHLSGMVITLKRKGKKNHVLIAGFSTLSTKEVWGVSSWQAVMEGLANAWSFFLSLLRREEREIAFSIAMSNLNC